ncbi:uncharacterized protein ANIA_10009 [Aspergillus nidulans FGSC A4]|uniref:Uncharacterized protein n=1 Tax=Emericella nidulans (strain FGSC A4 / ATCC 38163 / CBS 112.46 / NRRL 194 / M139) TaxID=227321 RepID=C8VRH6_EMENI|nr:hypothetical protein [Aspergillus nidulans FGSC A4]CBF90384.1 TPA: hypothetical protein ANIA_10009 [Aspergillus nidulans FGSC A4]
MIIMISSGLGRLQVQKPSSKHTGNWLWSSTQIENMSPMRQPNSNYSTKHMNIFLIPKNAKNTTEYINQC